MAVVLNVTERRIEMQVKYCVNLYMVYVVFQFGKLYLGFLKTPILIARLRFIRDIISGNSSTGSTWVKGG